MDLERAIEIAVQVHKGTKDKAGPSIPSYSGIE